MTISRRVLLGGMATGLGAIPLRATSIAPAAWGNFGLEIEGARLTQGGWLRGRVIKPEQITALRLGEVAVVPDENGRFFIGFDRDAGDVAFLTAACKTSAPCAGRLDAVTREKPQFGFSIAPRKWQIERINAPFRPPALPDVDFARIRKGELAQIAAARSMISDAAGWRQNFVWPLKGALRGRFGAQRIYRGTPGAYHAGLDISGATGTPFTAPADGVVTLAAAAPFTLEGNLLIIDHGSGLSSAFLHCSQLAVKPGDRVRQGQLLGWVGKTGRTTGPHLHWALKWRDTRLDPLLFVTPQG